MRNPFVPQIIMNCKGEPYLIRWRIVWTKWVSVWSFATLILANGYTEITPRMESFQKPGSFLHRPAPWPHRLVLDRPAWTLVFVGPRKRRWGFYAPSGWMHWKSFLNAKGCGETDGQP